MNANQAKPPSTIHDVIPEQYRQYQTVFEETPSRELPPHRSCDHAINLKPGTDLSNRCKIYPLNPAEQQAQDIFLKDMLDHGYIQKSQSPFASPFFFVKKKDGKLRPVQDYRQLNAVTIAINIRCPLSPTSLISFDMPNTSQNSTFAGVTTTSGSNR